MVSDITSPFRSTKRRLARTREHIAKLKAAIEHFYTKDLLKQVVEDEYVGIEVWNAVKFRQVLDVPDDLGDSAAEAFDAIRSSLDQACSASATALGHKDPKFANFPFADDEGQLENVIKGRCKNLHPEIVNLIRALKPYEEGNRLLWALNRVRRRNQHHVLVDVGLNAQSIMVRKLHLIHGDFDLPMPWWDKEKREVTVLRSSKRTRFSALDIGVRVFPVLTDADILTGEPVVAVLDELLSIVESIVMGIEAETVRLRRLPQ